METSVMTNDQIFETLNRMFPNAHCELNYHNDFELLCAVVLSAQTTDVSVNRVTPGLFEAYPDPFSMAQADPSHVESLIHSIGLYKNKAKNLIALARKLTEDFDGILPKDRETLTQLPGVGIKTANVVLAELYQIPAIAVDTHVARVARRLNLALQSDSPEVIETKLENFFKKEHWCRLHHLLIFFGRYHCLARNPLCDECPFKTVCSYPTSE